MTPSRASTSSWAESGEDTFIRPLYDQPRLPTPNDFSVMLQAAEGGWPAMLPLQLNISAACADESVLRKTLLAILLLEQARKEAGCFSVVVHTALYRRQWKERDLIEAAYLENGT
ncbi:hypothetical protein BDW71DRAFT_176359 [Aspergillus fruticulosus]